MKTKSSPALKLICGLLSLACVFTVAITIFFQSNNAFAATSSYSDGTLNYTIDDVSRQASVNGCVALTCPAAINIPATVNDGTYTYDVTTISNSAFANQTSVTDVTIPASITFIDQLAFANMHNYGAPNIAFHFLGTTSPNLYYNMMDGTLYEERGLTIDLTGCNGLTTGDTAKIACFNSYYEGTNATYGGYPYLNWTRVMNMNTVTPKTVPLIAVYTDGYPFSGWGGVPLPEFALYQGGMFVQNVNTSTANVTQFGASTWFIASLPSGTYNVYTTSGIDTGQTLTVVGGGGRW